MLALDHLLNFIEYLDRTFIVGDKQGLQDCFKIINSLRSGAGLKGPMASNLGDEIVNDVSFLFFGHAPKHYSFIQLTEPSLSNVHQRLPHHRTPRFLAPLRLQRYSRNSSQPST
jgi:hypothetical protein